MRFIRFVFIAVGAMSAAVIFSYGIAVKFAGRPVSLGEAGALVSQTLQDVTSGKSGQRLFMEIPRAPERDLAGSPQIDSASSPPAGSLPIKSPAALLPKRPIAPRAPAPPARAAASSTLPPSILSVSAAPAPPAQAQQCDFSSQGPTHLVLINEIAWMGSPMRGGEDSAGGAQGEWIELKNNSGADINLAGWLLTNKAGKFKIAFGAGDIMKEGALFLLERGDDDVAPDVAAEKIYSGALANSGDWLRLFDRSCVLADEIDSSAGWPAGDNASKRTMERSAIDLSWHASANVGGTPKTENSAIYARNTPPLRTGTLSVVAPAPQPAQSSSSTPAGAEGDASSTASSSLADGTPTSSSTPTSTPPFVSGVNHVVIAAVQITGGPGNTTNDFVRILNPLATPFNLKGHRLVKRAKTSASDTLLKSWTADVFVAPGGYYTWANSSYAAFTPPADATTTGSIADDNGVAIREGPNDTGTILDALAWGAAQNGFAEGSAYASNPTANQSLARKMVSGAVQDTDNNAADFEIQ